MGEADETVQAEHQPPLLPWEEIAAFLVKRDWLIGLGLVLLGFSLRIGGMTGFWLNPDEGIYYGALTSSFADFWTEVLERNAHPPLYYLLLRGMGLFSTEFVWFRSLSLVLGCLGSIGNGKRFFHIMIRN